jgi:hypothetical protein
MDQDPLYSRGLEEQGVEDFLNQFFTNVESVKVKNLSDEPITDEMIAFLSLGAKFCPVELDIDRKQLEKDLEAWYRRMRIKANFR